jgi:hypothetical protein
MNSVTTLMTSYNAEGMAIFTAGDPCSIAHFVRVRNCTEVAQIIENEGWNVEGAPVDDAAEPTMKKASHKKKEKVINNVSVMKKVDQMLINRQKLGKEIEPVEVSGSESEGDGTEDGAPVNVRCAFSDRNLHPRMPLWFPRLLRLNRAGV